MRDLDELGWLPEDVAVGGEGDAKGMESLVSAGEGLPWFETMVKGSKLGKMRRSRASKTADSGRFRVEWEIVEWTNEAGESEVTETVPGKRKLEDVEGDVGDMMDGVHSG